jgi:hypothetical protein
VTFYYNYHCIPDYLEDTDVDGMFTFHVDAATMRAQAIPTGTKTKHDYMVRVSDVMKIFFMRVGIVRLRGAWLDRLDASCIPDGDHWVARVNMLKALHMPGKDRFELDMLKEFFEICKEYMLALPAYKRGIVKFTNERDRNGKVFGKVTFTVIGDWTPEADRAADEATDKVDAWLLSPVAQEWLRNVALELSKIGRYSWWDMSEEHLFKRDKGPYARHIAAQYEAIYKKGGVLIGATT